MAHAYMLAAPAGEEREKKARQLAAELLCEADNAPCGQCRDCRKSLAGNHPDMIWLRRQTDDKGKPRREITVDQVRAMAADAAVAPNEAARKVYIVPEADLMNVQAQNALLKALEDPPGHACFILCTVSTEDLLPTVRSRLVRAEYRGEDPAAEDEYTPFAREYLMLLAAGKKRKLAAFCANRSQMTGEELLQLIDSIRQQLCEAACGRTEDFAPEYKEIMRLGARMDKAEQYLKRNISVKQVLGLLAVTECGGDSPNGKERMEIGNGSQY